MYRPHYTLPMKSQRYWQICCVAVILLAGVTFTPLIIPANTWQPELFGVPYTLWTGFLLAWAFVGLTYIATRVHPGADNDSNP